MSKSKGNLITANELLDMFESDTLRFYFSFKGPETNDMNCSIDDIIQTHNKFLVGMLGNFVNRNLSFIKKKFDGNITEGTIDEKIKEATNKTYHLAGEYFEKGEIKNAVTSIMEYVNLANKYYDSREPWKQVKENISDLEKQDMIDIIRRNFGIQVKDLLYTYEKEQDKKAILLVVGIALIILYYTGFASILKDVILMFGWLAICSSVYGLIFSSTEIYVKIKRLKNLSKARIYFD